MSFTPVSRGVLQRKCACGTHTMGEGHCAECQKKNMGVGGRLLQTKLAISEPGDQYEQEADRVAEQVMHIAGPQKQEDTDIPRGVDSSCIQRSCLGCRDVRKEGSNVRIRIMTKGLGSGSCDSIPEDKEEDADKVEEETAIMPKGSTDKLHKPNESLGKRLSLTRGGGNPLSKDARLLMESRFGHDFSSVRVHTDYRADLLTGQLNAEAFTSGADIYFKSGRYNPESRSGVRLLAHELTHVVQQNFRSTSDRIQPYRLKGFPAAEEAKMHAAIPNAISKVKACSKLSWWGKYIIPPALRRMRYDYVPDLGLCGWTFPASWYIEVGPDAFKQNVCCDLESTLAHEAAHTEWYTEGRARAMECNCFGCSC